MKREELEAIEAREQAAAPGPWWLTIGNRIVCPRGHTIKNTISNMLFSAHARQDVPALLAEVKRLNAETERLARERNAAVADLRRVSKAHEDCHACAHIGGNTARCDFGEDCWEWRGART